ncbi:MAG: hypothetical protein M3154_09015, partial [Candidatus Eremiobacteraeota bacterium]|nr:hypothetical protein [Candidatus Eremiobacteraeota bacterium]
ARRAVGSVGACTDGAGVICAQSDIGITMLPASSDAIASAAPRVNRRDKYFTPRKSMSGNGRVR